jgi:hypothetical protein
MKMILKKVTYTFSMAILISLSVFAGNEDRAGSAGGTQLLINPFARSSGLAGSNMAAAKGVEGMFLNVADLASVTKFELLFSNSNWLSGSGISINSLGLGVKVGESSTLGLSITSINVGDIFVTTTELPDNQTNTFSPRLLNLGLSYAKSFSNSISGGITLRILSEAITDAKATGACFDAGIRYVTGDKDRIKFGIALKNVGPPITYRGDGLSFSGQSGDNNIDLTVQQRTDNYELPSLVSIGFSYDIFLAQNHKLTPNANFISNSFNRDQFIGGLEYNYKDMFFLRGGYLAEQKADKSDIKTNALTGLHAGASLALPLGKSGSKFSVDYSYRATNPFNGVHTIGVTFNIGEEEEVKSE